MEKSRLRWIALTVAAAMFVSNLDSTLIVTSLPQIAAAFGLRGVDLSAAISGYVLASAALLPLSAWLADRHGARNIFVLSLVLFTLSSAGCALAQNYPQFLGARLLQGAAGALMVPVGRTVVLQRHEGRDLMDAMALITWPGLMAPVIAPLLGGVITTYSTWRWNFLLNLPLGILAVTAALRLMPRAESLQRRPLDVPGMAYLAIGLAGLLYAMELFSAGDRNLRLTLATLAIGGGATLLGMRHLQRAAHPLLELSAYRVPTFWMTNGSVALVFRATVAATPFLLPLLLQLAHGLNALQAGTFIMAYFFGNLAMKSVTTPTLQRFGFRTVLIWNGVLSGVATAGLGFIDPHHGRIVALALLFVAGMARSMQFTSMNTLGFTDLTARQRSAGSTLHSILQSISTALGVGAAAILLQRIASLRGVPQPGLADFRLTFVVLGVAGVVSALCYQRLDRDAGARVSGHQPR